MKTKHQELIEKERKEFLWDFSMGLRVGVYELLPTPNVKKTKVDTWLKLVTSTPQLRAFSSGVDLKWESV